jgi:hypothetical protein
MALTFTSPTGTDPPRRIAADDEQEKETTHPPSKRKPEAGKAKVDDDNITKNHTMIAKIAKPARGPNGPERGPDTSSQPNTPARKLVSVEFTFNTESVLNV